MTLRLYITWTAMLLLSTIAVAQPDTIPADPMGPQLDDLYLTLIHKNYEDSTVLRWAPSRIDGWITGMNNGYTIQKLELDSDMEPVGDWDTLVTDLILPYSMDQFKAEIAQHPDDVFLAAAAESMYGFQLEYADGYQGKSIVG